MAGAPIAARPQGTSIAAFVLFLLSAWCAPHTAGAQTAATGVVSGQVLDSGDSRPVGGVLVLIDGVGRAETNSAGFFVMDGVPAGEHLLQVSHLGFGEHSQHIISEAGSELSLTIRISVEAIELTPFVVEARSELDQRRRSSGNSINEIGRDEIEAASRVGMGLTELLQTSMPGTMASQTSRSTTCVQYRAIRSGGQTACREVSVFLDGVQVASPSYIYQSLPLSDIERIEMLSPGQAGIRYGTASGQAVLVIETKRGEVMRKSDVSRFVTGFQWMDQGAGYRWAGVLTKTTLVNAALVAGALVLADKCLWSPEEGALGLRTRCNGLSTASVGLLSVAVPAVAGGYVAQRGGESLSTRGRLAPTALAAGMILTGGYLLVVHGGDSAERAGYAILGAGVPLTLSLSDRIFRARREP